MIACSLNLFATWIVLSVLNAENHGRMQIFFGMLLHKERTISVRLRPE
jgi:hypothetical protein